MPRIYIPSAPELSDAKPDLFLAANPWAFGGQGKTWLSTRLFRGNDKHPSMYPMIYVASDPTSPGLASVAPEDREDIIVLEPDGWPENYNGKPRPYDEACRIAEAEWETWGDGCAKLLGEKRFDEVRRKWPAGARTFEWDTITSTSEEIMYQSSGQATDLPRSVKSSVGEGDTKTKVLDRSDYGLAQYLATKVIKKILRRKMHRIVLSHEFVTDPDKGPVHRGPGTVGAGSVMKFPQLFEMVFQCERRVMDEGDDAPVRVYMQPDLMRIVKIQSNLRPHKSLVIRQTPQARQFWAYLLELKSGGALKEGTLKSGIPANVRETEEEVAS